MPVPEAAGKVRVNHLLPLQALAETEALLDPGAATVWAAEGRASEVLRNLCYHVHRNRLDWWAQLAERIDSLFGVALEPSRYRPKWGEVALTDQAEGLSLDISAVGRGLQQTLLLLSCIAGNPGSVLLLDEPDAHLEPLRQRQMYRLVRETARACGCQIIAATHSGVLLNEAAGRDLAVAFVGVPHRIGRDRREDVLRIVQERGFELYLQAEQTGWALYLNSPTDLAALQVLARRLGLDDAAEALAASVRAVCCQPPRRRAAPLPRLERSPARTARRRAPRGRWRPVGGDRWKRLAGTGEVEAVRDLELPLHAVRPGGDRPAESITFWPRTLGAARANP